MTLILKQVQAYHEAVLFYENWHLTVTEDRALSLMKNLLIILSIQIICQLPTNGHIHPTKVPVDTHDFSVWPKHDTLIIAKCYVNRN